MTLEATGGFVRVVAEERPCHPRLAGRGPQRVRARRRLRPVCWSWARAWNVATIPPFPRAGRGGAGAALRALGRRCASDACCASSASAGSRPALAWAHRRLRRPHRRMRITGSAVFGAIWNIKPRLFRPRAALQNPRDSYGYRYGLRLAPDQKIHRFYLFHQASNTARSSGPPAVSAARPAAPADSRPGRRRRRVGIDLQGAQHLCRATPCPRPKPRAINRHRCANAQNAKQGPCRQRRPGPPARRIPPPAPERRRFFSATPMATGAVTDLGASERSTSPVSPMAQPASTRHDGRRGAPASAAISRRPQLRASSSRLSHSGNPSATMTGPEQEVNELRPQRNGMVGHLGEHPASCPAPPPTTHRIGPGAWRSAHTARVQPHTRPAWPSGRTAARTRGKPRLDKIRHR